MDLGIPLIIPVGKHARANKEIALPHGKLSVFISFSSD